MRKRDSITQGITLAAAVCSQEHGPSSAHREVKYPDIQPWQNLADEKLLDQVVPPIHDPCPEVGPVVLLVLAGCRRYRTCRYEEMI